MKICIPTSAHDKHLLAAQADCLLKLGGLEEHQVLYFPTLSAKEAAYEVAEKLGAEVHPFDRDFPGGAPVACNNHFAMVVDALGKMGNTEPFLLMEPDMIPAPGAHRWPDRLLEDYRMRGAPFMGNVVPTPFNVDGKLEYVDGDTMMMGCGVYPAHMERDERIKPMIKDLSMPEWMNPKIPWDIYLRWAIKTIGVSDTPLIADMWATEKYHVTAKGIECQSVDHGDKVVRKRGGVVPKTALLIHGCKDGSLAQIMLGRERSAPVGKNSALIEYHMPKIPVPLHVPTIAVGTDGSRERSAVVLDSVGCKGNMGQRDPAGVAFFTATHDWPAVLAELTQEDGEFWGAEDKQPAQSEPAEPETVIPVVAPKPKAATPVEAPKPARCTVTRAAIEKAMAGKPMRASALAEKLNVKVEDLIGTFATNGYVVATAGWVKSTIPITAD